MQARQPSSNEITTTTPTTPPALQHPGGMTRQVPDIAAARMAAIWALTSSTTTPSFSAVAAIAGKASLASPTHRPMSSCISQPICGINLSWSSCSAEAHRNESQQEKTEGQPSPRARRARTGHDDTVGIHPSIPASTRQCRPPTPCHRSETCGRTASR